MENFTIKTYRFDHTHGWEAGFEMYVTNATDEEIGEIAGSLIANRVTQRVTVFDDQGREFFHLN